MTFKILNRDKWLETIFKKNCYIAKGEKYINLFKNYKESFIFLKTKKPINNKFLLDDKLKFLGINKTFSKSIKFIDVYKKNKEIQYKTNLNNSEKKNIINIAYKNFNYSRFHLDDRLSVEKANLIKKKTLENHFLGLRGDKMFTQFYKGKTSGFCLLNFEGDNSARIDLICIDKKFSKKGLATDLLRYSLYNLRKKMYKEKVVVSTQENNVAAIKLYESFKFITKNKFFLYHYIS